jgi:hypothetical protein
MPLPAESLVHARVAEEMGVVAVVAVAVVAPLQAWVHRAVVAEAALIAVAVVSSR